MTKDRLTHCAGWLTSSAILLVATSLLGGCASMQQVDNREEVSEGLSYQAEYRSPRRHKGRWRDTAVNQNLKRCGTGGTSSGAQPVAAYIPQDDMLLSSGDLLTIAVGNDPTFSGSYEVSQDGSVRLPHLPSIQAKGMAIEAVERKIAAALVSGDIYSAAPPVSVRLQDFAPARVYVSGAVFNPGTVDVGGVSGADRDDLRQTASGGTAESRRLSRALQSAGGIRPDADLSAVRIVRNGRSFTADARGAMQGIPFNDMLLLSGDRIEVDSRGCFQGDLVAPSPVTTPGVKVFMSNLTQPAAANALSAVGKDARELRYGTRFLEAIVGMNCLGGTRWVNADRTAALISRNPLTGQSIVIERKVEELLRHRDRDDFNPFMMPGDALACYDSKQVNLFEVAKGFTGVAGAATAALNIWNN
ncbi:polysaccharide biosynthesis/export family protein [Notoacmeibacter sp. MSK16QG-6]|uniref:polysaccharide biosynthesis/export family protein n=1 Tax=Notoacmeibacter sp. MSK16QG-6 TaxID=2957982 RepID=UPI0020A02985|nr:polysaccharide biosynthesis/export family protein [Notoacmeibacter sp. MSK16QG-6]MCP1199069.1 polysaccharide export protein [Notoacmeibacter sp. MSK16QG-6]